MRRRAKTAAFLTTFALASAFLAVDRKPTASTAFAFAPVAAKALTAAALPLTTPVANASARATVQMDL